MSEPVNLLIIVPVALPHALVFFDERLLLSIRLLELLLDVLELVGELRQAVSLVVLVLHAQALELGLELSEVGRELHLLFVDEVGLLLDLVQAGVLRGD